jgi:hypothetical protein
MAGNELIDGIGKLITYFIDIFSAILYSLFKPILSNPSNFGTEPSAYIGNLVIGIIDLILYLFIIFAVYSIIRWLLSIVEDKDMGVRLSNPCIHQPLSIYVRIISLAYKDIK